MNTNTPCSLQEQLSHMFGSYKAEWLKEKIFELFTEPAYFPELTTNRSCILIGGRGTGKTTVLKGLSYQGQFALQESAPSRIANWSWYGLYYRVNTNHVTAFRGELTEEQWAPIFAHYVNLLLCDLVLEFVEWYEMRTGNAVNLGEANCLRIAQSLHLAGCLSHNELRAGLEESRIRFEAFINNVIDADRPPLSMQAAPLDYLCSVVQSVDMFQGTQFFFLIDEYENLLDYQQQVMNTLIKHSGNTYCFKIGVRELGWRCRSTLNPIEQLVHPADYARINIMEKLQGETFRQFALKVCERRLQRITLDGQQVLGSLQQALVGLTEEEEAIELGVGQVADSVRDELLKDCDEQEAAAIKAMTPLEVFFIDYWAKSQGCDLFIALQDATSDPDRWQDRFNNYKYAILYTIRKGKPGIRKYYSGWDTFTMMAAGNIRYVLELVDQCLLAQYQSTGTLSSSISPRIQTGVAQRVGSMNLSELEGLSVDGAQLTKFLLSLGRVFQVMASDVAGHAPEVNQFHVTGPTDPGGRSADEGVGDPVSRLLTSAVMHLALVRTLGNKLGDVGDTKDYDYMIHPIYSALFEFSPRRKRKMALSGDQILGLIQRPRETIRSVLRAQNRPLDSGLPEQLTLFERFYNANSE